MSGAEGTSGAEDMTGAEVPVFLAVVAAVRTMVSGWPLVSKLVGKFGRLFKGKPKRTNDTMNQILERQGLAGQAMLEEAARHVEEMKHQAEEGFTAMRLEAENSRRTREAALEKAERQAEESHRAGQAALKDAEAAVIALQQGIQPIVWPSPQQIKEALRRIEYDEEKFHFGVVGSSGSGKSSFINAVRGLADRHPNAAEVGQIETTTKIHRYADPRKDLPFSRLVWYDIPGAGTLNIPDWDYFNSQGLFVFDFLILVYDVRFTLIDVGIIENCIRFHIPFFIVRSKADVHITNMVKSKDELGPRDEKFEESYKERMTEFVAATRSNISGQIETLKDRSQERARKLYRSDSKYAINLDVENFNQTFLSHQTVYIVSAEQLQALQKDFNPKKPIDDSKTIDERRLFVDLLSVAAVRRYSEDMAEDPSFFKSSIPSSIAMFHPSNQRP